VAPIPFSRLFGTFGRRAVETIAPRRTFDDVILSPVTRRALESALAQVTQHNLIFEGWDEAIAQSLGRQLLVVRYAELESMWMGETSKNVSAIFRTAREEQAVLFFDEADAIAARRIDLSR
jgi:hypothetical protein